jgi:hypothetical protein
MKLREVGDLPIVIGKGVAGIELMQWLSKGKACVSRSRLKVW